MSADLLFLAWFLPAVILAYALADTALALYRLWRGKR